MHLLKFLPIEVKMMKQVKFLIGVFVALLLISCDEKKEIPNAEVTAIAKEAYVYGYPMVKNYSVMYASAVDNQNPNYKKPFNEFYMSAKVDTPVDMVKESVTNDTPLGSVWLDLRREPVVLTVPEVEQGRYYSVQLTDLYSYNFDYIGTRTDGNKAGKFIIAGPGWTGEKPEGIDRIITSDTQFVYGLVRIQLMNADDVANIEKLQSGFMIQPLSEFAGTQAPAEVAPVKFPDYDEAKISTTDFFSYMNFIMQFAKEPKEEADLLKRFAKVGIIPGKSFKLEDKNAKKPYQSGIDGAIADLDAAQKGDLIKSSEMHGTRAILKNNYMNRAYGSIVDLYGASSVEILSVTYKLDSEFKLLNGANQYAIRFEKDKLPPTDAFWSLTLYEAKEKGLVENPVKRYYINSTMVSKMVADPVDGSVTVFIEKEEPVAEQMQKVADAINAAMPAVVSVPKESLNVKADAKVEDKADAKANATPKAEGTDKLAKADDTKVDVKADEKGANPKEALVKPLEVAKKVVATPVTESLVPNWLPAPGGDFYMVLRVYIPKIEALNGLWKAPDVIRFGTELAVAETPAEAVDTATKPTNEAPTDANADAKAEPKADAKVDAKEVVKEEAKPAAPVATPATPAATPVPVENKVSAPVENKVAPTGAQSPIASTTPSPNKPKTVIINPVKPLPKVVPTATPTEPTEPAKKP